MRIWLGSVGLAAGTFVALLLARGVLGARLAAFAKRTETQLDDLAASLVASVHAVVLAVVGLWVGASLLGPTAAVRPFLRTMLVLALGFQAGRLGTTVIVWGATLRAGRIDPTDRGQVTTLHALSLLLRLVLYAALLLVILDNFGINVSTLLAGLGVGGIAVALATQNILGDLFASLSIMLDKPFEVGDFIIVGDALGTVERIGLKTTRVRSLSGEQLILSNGDLLASRIRNYKRMAERRAVFSFRLGYETPADRLAEVPRVVERIIRAVPATRFDRAHLARLGDSALEFEAVYWMEDPDYNRYMDAQQAINLALLRQLADAGISFAYPTRTLYLRHADRSRTVE
jgi:small-conductance mechanosensitive channel